MIQTAFNIMTAILLARFVLNDVPHVLGLGSPTYDEPPTPRQLRYIASLCQQLKIRTPYEEQVRTRGEAGRMIRELEEEKRYRKKLGSSNPSSFRIERTAVDRVLDDLERTWHRIEPDTSYKMQSSLRILKEVMGYYYEEPCVAAWDNNSLVGIAVYGTSSDVNLGIQSTHIKELASFTHKPGIGKFLIDEVTRIGREEDSDIVSLSHGPGVRPFYEKLGFVQNTYYPEEPTLMMYRLSGSNPDKI